MKRKLTVLVCAVMALCLSLGSLTGCSKKKISNEKTAFVISSDELDGVFNPFFYTSGPDGEVVGMTQLGMLSTDHNGKLVCGNDEPTVVLDWEENYDSTKGPKENGKPIGETTYTFVLKNGLKFSDGVPLSIRDVLFNLYVYLDPVYTGSSTIYSTDIKGLSRYRTRSSDAGADITLETSATGDANTRRTNLINDVNKILKDAPKDVELTDDYVINRLSTEAFKTDYKKVMELFKKEIEDDYKNAVGAYKQEPYNFTDVEGFMYNEGIVTWDKKTNSVKLWGYDHEGINTRDKAIKYIYDTNMPAKFEGVVRYWGTAVDLMEEFTADAKEELLKKRTGYRNIEGIVALDGATTEKVTVNGKDYAVANLPHGHHDDGSYDNWGDFNSDWSVSGDKYQVLQITINGVDPKARYNFSFSVAPMHYYSSDALTKAFSIDDDQFGVLYSNRDFMEKEVNHPDKVGLPVGAGPYKATDRNNSTSPNYKGFFDNNIVYFTRNDNFLLGAPKIKLVRYQVINQAQAINSVRSGSVHYAQPQATSANMADIESSSGTLAYETNKQNGYGYIGINAGKIPNVWLRRAIMYACNTELALEYYGEFADNLNWPMSKDSFAYPHTNDVPRYPYGNGVKDADGKVTDEAVRKIVLYCMNQAKIYTNPAGTEITTTVDGRTLDLNYTFTIAGSSLTEHPTYSTLREAARLLNSCGWNVKVDPDNYALSKLANGSLTVWAAAWSTTIDPDMYQVYHRNSTATSTYSWGYREMKNGAPSGKVKLPVNTLDADYAVVRQLSTVIDAARKKTLDSERAPLYATALGYVMDLAVELPVYQRDNIFLYNSKYVDGDSLVHSDSPYTNPLSEIWNVSLNEG